MSADKFKLHEVMFSDRQLFMQFYTAHKQKVSVKKNERLFMLHKGDTPLAALKITPIYLHHGSIHQCEKPCVWLLRNMFVPECHRRQGYALNLLHCLTPYFNDMATGEQGHGVFCFPWQHLTPLYIAAGFQVVPVKIGEPLCHSTQLPLEIEQRYRKYRSNGLDIEIGRWH